ncbi:MAG: OmpA family protein [Zetaproteobacteria bacterium]|nr:OmpA family protein [Zetaproteobacteria bacterium]
MIKRLSFLATATLTLASCASHIETNVDQLSEARAAVAAAKNAGAEYCAPKEQAQAVANLYFAGHEVTEGDYHPEENDRLIAATISNANAALAKSQHGCAIAIPGVLFENDSAKITTASNVILDNAVAVMKKHTELKVEVGAHTDSVGSTAYNLKLSDRRAQSVMNYLTSHGVSANRLTSKGYGESKPVAKNNSEENRAKNRRVELNVIQ